MMHPVVPGTKGNSLAPNKTPVLNPIRVTITYAIFAAFWIWLSDLWIVRFELSPQNAFLFAVMKGMLFVCISSWVLYLLVRKMADQIERDVAARRALELQFLRAQRMDAIGKLSADIAHDFKNHLMVISSYAELLNITEERDRTRREAILNAVERCDKLNRDLLAYSRKQELEPIPTSIKTAISSMSGILETALGVANAVVMQLQSEWIILIDRGKLEQLLLNLAVNSKDAMPDGGTFRIEASDLRVESGFQGLAVPSGDYVQLVISDTGQGISEENFPHLFEPFFTTKERGKGTGLGLAAVYGIVKQSGGFIFAENKPTHGTTFRMLFPRYVG